MLMLQQLIADAKAMEVESSTAEREAQKDYEAFGKARPLGGSGGGDSPRTCSFFGGNFYELHVYIYIQYIYILCTLIFM
jgi:hypothetical protein